MLSITVSKHARPLRDDFQSEQDRHIERWRIARKLVQLLREAGYSCELSNDEFRIGPRFSELDRPGEATGSIEPKLFTK